jgi:hypothetical protein
MLVALSACDGASSTGCATCLCLHGASRSAVTISVLCVAGWCGSDVPGLSTTACVKPSQLAAGEWSAIPFLSLQCNKRVSVRYASKRLLPGSFWGLSGIAL